MKNFEEPHEALTKVAKAQNSTASSLLRSVSRHTLPETTSFANLEAIHAAAQVPCYVGTSGKELAISAHFEAHATVDDDATLPVKKRRRNTEAEERAERKKKREENRAAQAAAEIAGKGMTEGSLSKSSKMSDSTRHSGGTAEIIREWAGSDDAEEYEQK